MWPHGPRNMLAGELVSGGSGVEPEGQGRSGAGFVVCP